MTRVIVVHVDPVLLQPPGGRWLSECGIKNQQQVSLGSQVGVGDDGEVADAAGAEQEVGGPSSPAHAQPTAPRCTHGYSGENTPADNGALKNNHHHHHP